MAKMKTRDWADRKASELAEHIGKYGIEVAWRDVVADALRSEREACALFVEQRIGKVAMQDIAKAIRELSE